MKYGKLNQDNLKSHFRWYPPKNIVVNVFGNRPVGSIIIGQYIYIYILTNNVQELTPYMFKIKFDTNKTRK
jgi:hypothetical protein